MVYGAVRSFLWRLTRQSRPTSSAVCPDQHDEEHMDDQEEMEQAINKFLQLLEKQEKKGFKDQATLVSHLPKPAQGSSSFMSVAKAMEAGFLPALDEDQANVFSPSEFLLYWHTQDHRDILGYPSLFGDILG